MNHWDKDCRHATEGYRQARVNFASFTADVMLAEAEYEAAYESRFDSDEDLADLEGEQDTATADFGASAGHVSDDRDLDHSNSGFL